MITGVLERRRPFALLRASGARLGLGLGTVAAFAVSLIALPFMNAATRHDTVRFE